MVPPIACAGRWGREGGGWGWRRSAVREARESPWTRTPTEGTRRRMPDLEGDTTVLVMAPSERSSFKRRRRLPGEGSCLSSATYRPYRKYNLQLASICSNVTVLNGRTEVVQSTAKERLALRPLHFSQIVYFLTSSKSDVKAVLYSRVVTGHLRLVFGHRSGWSLRPAELSARLASATGATRWSRDLNASRQTLEYWRSSPWRAFRLL